MLPLSAAPNTLIVACGALARELLALTRDLPNVEIAFLPSLLHNRPDGIPGAVRERVQAARASGAYAEIFVAYADCGTGGLLDRVCEEEGVRRLEGAHCYEVYAGREAFARLQDDEPGTFYLTDYLVRSFEGLIVRGLGLDRHPELLPVYFGNYRRLVYLAQTDDVDLLARARVAADRLGLAFELRRTGYGELATAIAGLASRSLPSNTNPGGVSGNSDRAEAGQGRHVSRNRLPNATKRRPRHLPDHVSPPRLVREGSASAPTPGAA